MMLTCFPKSRAAKSRYRPRSQVQFARRRAARHRGKLGIRLSYDTLSSPTCCRRAYAETQRVANTYRHFARSTTRLSARRKRRRRRAATVGGCGVLGERERVFCRATTSTLRLTLMLVDIDVRHPTNAALQVAPRAPSCALRDF